MSATTDQPHTAPRPAATWRRYLTAVWWDLRTMAGNGEQLLVTVVIPIALLIGVARSGVPDLSPLPQAQGALAAAIAVAVVSSAFTGQSIALAFDRRAGLLRLLVASPLGRGGIVAGRVGSVVVLVALQVALLLAVALAIGVRVGPAQVAALVPVVAVATAAFASLGLLLGGTLRAEAVLAVANIAWLAMVSLGGLVVPADRLPGGALVSLLPPSLVGESVRQAVTTGTVDGAALVLLIGWALVFAVAAGRWLRWE